MGVFEEGSHKLPPRTFHKRGKNTEMEGNISRKKKGEKKLLFLDMGMEIGGRHGGKG